MSDNHPITPPPELVQQWVAESWHVQPRELRVAASDIHITAQAAKWGSNQELEACCEWVESEIGRKEWAAELRTARRSKPPSLKAQALEAQQRMWNGESTHGDWQLIRRALEQLND